MYDLIILLTVIIFATFLSLSTAWEVARIIHPPKKERLKRDKEIQEILELVRKEDNDYSDQHLTN